MEATDAGVDMGSLSAAEHLLLEVDKGLLSCIVSVDPATVRPPVC